jgi:DNA repair exonuclease SbcCD ATPase subunit
MNGTRLLSLEVQAFRGFNERQTFPLGDANILGGRNGFGKTSFFDAVLWCIFESIPRLAGTRDFQKAGNILQNKFSTEPCHVELAFETTDGELRLRRSLHGATARIADKQISDREALERLGLHDGDAMNRFLRNHLLQQDTINDFVRNLNPRDRYESMVSMLELQDSRLMGVQLDALSSSLAATVATEMERLSSAQARLHLARAEVNQLRELVTDTSEQIIEDQFQKFQNNLGPEFLQRLRASPESGDDLRARVVAFARAIAEVLSEVRKINIQLRAATQQPDVGTNVQARLAETTTALAADRDKLHALEAALATSEHETATKKQRLQAETQSQRKLQAALAAIRAFVDSDLCPVCQRPMDRKKLLQVLDDAIGTSGAPTVTLVQEVTRSEETTANLANEASALRLSVRGREAAVAALNRAVQDQSQRESAMSTLRSAPSVVRWGLSSDDPTTFSFKVTALLENLESANNELGALVGALDRLRSTARLPAKTAELAAAAATCQTAERVLAELNRKSATVDKCRQAVSASQQAFLQAIFELHKPLIQSLYHRMHPHPLFTDIDFEFGRAYGGGELYFKVLTPERAYTAYPSTIFSASQLNVLATAVFMALNLRTDSNLPMMMLDDPIHSMDDLNILGFCDVVRQTKTSRQLFISTHDRTLYGLLMNKLRPSSVEESVRGFWFAGWSEQGPSIEQETTEYIPTPVRWETIRDLAAPRPS